MSLNKTEIEWADSTWNPFVGCNKVSDGCAHCYAERRAWMLSRNPKLPAATREKYKRVVRDGRWTGAVEFFPERLTAPLKMRKPRRVFVGSMGDLFHESMVNHFDFIDDVMATVLASYLFTNQPPHDYLFLTKRPDIMLKYFTREDSKKTLFRIAQEGDYRIMCDDGDIYFSDAVRNNLKFGDIPWPLPNVWLGVTAENQEQADNRIHELLQIEGANCFVSIEPMLGPVDIRKWLPGIYECENLCGCRLVSPKEIQCFDCGFTGLDTYEVWGDGPTEVCPRCHKESYPVPLCPECGEEMAYDHPNTMSLGMVIVGGETGPGARPMHPDWVRAIRDDCQDAEVPFFFKSWGTWAPRWSEGDHLIYPDGTLIDGWHEHEDVREKNAEPVARVGKKRAGCLLDGREWREWPVEAVERARVLPGPQPGTGR